MKGQDGNSTRKMSLNIAELLGCVDDESKTWIGRGSPE